MERDAGARRPVRILAAEEHLRRAHPLRARRPRLDLRDDVLQLLGYLEDRHATRRNRARFAGPGIPRQAGLAILHLEGPESTDLDVLARGERAGHRLEEFIHGVRDVLLR